MCVSAFTRLKAASAVSGGGAGSRDWGIGTFLLTAPTNATVPAYDSGRDTLGPRGDANAGDG